MNLKRVNQQKDVQYGNGPVIYWMQRDQRGNDNWALIYAIEKAKELKTQPIVIFCSNFSASHITAIRFYVERIGRS
jgi:deoxyribodipyrimidine photo-lyase